MMLGDSRDRRGDRHEYALRALRLPLSEGEGTPKAKEVSRPHPVLLRALEIADREYERLMDTIDPKYYHEFAVPAHVEISEEMAAELRSALDLREVFPGVLGPEQMVYSGRHYKVWIQLFPCG
jgi:hypothetical protein